MLRSFGLLGPRHCDNLAAVKWKSQFKKKKKNCKYDCGPYRYKTDPVPKQASDV